MSTIGKLINHSYQVINVDAVGETTPAENSATALEVLNMMLDQWSLERLMVYYVKNSIFTITNGVGTYTIGPAVQTITTNTGTYTAGAISVTINGITITQTYLTNKATTIALLASNINNTVPNICTAVFATGSGGAHVITCTPTGSAPLVITVSVAVITGNMTVAVAQSTTISYLFDSTRPIKIIHAFIRSTVSGTNLDYPLEIIDNNQYQDIMMKGLQTTYPRFINYVPTYPTGQINLYPLPNFTSLSLGLSQTYQLLNAQSISDTVALPPGYESAIVYNLAIELATRFNATITPAMAAKAVETKANIKRVNNEKTTSIIGYPQVSGKRTFNIYAGR